MRRLCGIVATALLGACAPAPFATLGRVDAEAGALAPLGWFLVALSCLLIVGMTVLIVWGVRRRRGSLDRHLPVDAGGGQRWILYGGVVMPVVVLTGLFLLTLVALGTIRGSLGRPDLTIAVTGHQWWWQVDYAGDGLQDRFQTANEIHVPVGATVRIELSSADVIHSFWVPRLFGKLDAIPGHTNRFDIRADRPGTYRGECAEYCGVQHAHMRFAVVAESQEAFDAWTAQQREPAQPPAGPVLTSGRNAFEQYACALCHRVRGTAARGSIGPDLTHIGSRLTLGAGRVPNTRARLQAWIIDAQALKPGIAMPAFDELDGPTLDALAAYLESLE